MIDEKARERIADQASRLMAAGWRGNPNMSGDDRDFMTPSMRRKHDDKVRSVVDFVLSQIQALRPGSTGETEGWRDIASAPKDGTHILAWHKDHGPTEAVWHDDEDPEWYCGWIDYHADNEFSPTHWRPLPSPPSAMLAAAGGRE